MEGAPMSLREWFGLLADELRCTTNDLLFAYATRAGIPNSLGGVPLAAAEGRARSGDSHGEPPSARSVPTSNPLAALPPDAREGEGPCPGSVIRDPHIASYPRRGTVHRLSYYSRKHDWRNWETCECGEPGCLSYLRLRGAEPSDGPEVQR